MHTNTPVKAIFFTRFLLIVLLAGGAVWASIPPDQVKISTPAYSPDPSAFSPRLGTYVYDVSWQGIAAGNIEFDISRKGDTYHISANAATGRFIDIFYKLRYHTEAVISAHTLLPRHWVSVSRENDRTKETRVDFRPNGTVHSMRKYDEGKVDTLEFKPDNFTLEPISIACMALSLDWHVGATRRFDAFTGKSRYLIEITAKDLTTISVGGRSRKAIVLSLTSRKLTENQPKKIKDAKIYISAEKKREILKVSSNLFIGSMESDLVAYTPAARR